VSGVNALVSAGPRMRSLRRTIALIDDTGVHWSGAGSDREPHNRTQGYSSDRTIAGRKPATAGRVAGDPGSVGVLVRRAAWAALLWTAGWRPGRGSGPDVRYRL
jgi:hypothetical protein